MLNEIQTRYTDESKNSCNNLSCGSNLDFLSVAAGEKILDLGCGRGKETIQAAIESGPDGSATGLDITPAMIKAARINTESAGVSNASYVYGDIENLPFKDASFDAVMSNCVINHARNKENVYHEIFRVLKYGGRFIISDAVTRLPLPDSVKNDPEAWAQCFGGAVTEEEYLSGIHAAGFYHIDILNRREYLKNGYDFISLTLRAVKEVTK
ncbi:MAG TPA: methyltransferase domain-containing protein [Clostridia bacterium]|nr:methyltransferase domain-containing protein [Clostridia bacterium]